MAPTFRTVLRGYEPAQVDAELGTLQQALDAARAELGELTVQLKESRQGQFEAEARLTEAQARAEEAARARTMASRPTYEDLGDRVGQILSLAEEECDRVIDWQAGDLPVTRGDATLLRQVWYNLIDNAVNLRLYLLILCLFHA